MHLGISSFHWQKTSDGDLIPIKNNIAALQKGQLDVVRNLIGIKEIPSEFPGFEVNLKSAAIWAIRDMHLHGSVPDEVVFNLKTDGRSFFGKCICILYFNCVFCLPYYLVSFMTGSLALPQLTVPC